MNKKDSTPSIIALGEALIDFVSLQSGVGLIEAASFKKAAGGAPANVAAGLGKLGVDCAFIGRVGTDQFGEFLIETLKGCHVNISGISCDEDARTMLAFVSLGANGERDFMFYRHPSADMLLAPEHIDETLFKGADIFHFGSISLGAEPCREATLQALKYAKDNNLFISYDPNLRLNLWDSADHAKKEILAALPSADFLKINEDELAFLTGSADLEMGIKIFLNMGPSIVAVTIGPKGTCIGSRSAGIQTIPVVDVPVVDTTGAGDTFVAGFLSQLLPFVKSDQIATLTAEQIRQMTIYANTAAAITTSGRGAIDSMPDSQQVQELLCSIQATSL